MLVYSSRQSPSCTLHLGPKEYFSNGRLRALLRPNLSTDIAKVEKKTRVLLFKTLTSANYDPHFGSQQIRNTDTLDQTIILLHRLGFWRPTEPRVNRRCRSQLSLLSLLRCWAYFLETTLNHIDPPTESQYSLRLSLL